MTTKVTNSICGKKLGSFLPAFAQHINEQKSVEEFLSFYKDKCSAEDYLDLERTLLGMCVDYCESMWWLRKDLKSHWTKVVLSDDVTVTVDLCKDSSGHWDVAAIRSFDGKREDLYSEHHKNFMSVLDAIEFWLKLTFAGYDGEESYPFLHKFLRDEEI